MQWHAQVVAAAAAAGTWHHRQWRTCRQWRTPGAGATTADGRVGSTSANSAKDEQQDHRSTH